MHSEEIFLKNLCFFAFSGAELIEGLRRKQVKIQAQREEEILQKIKQKMDRIKANQQKLQPALTAPKEHYPGKLITCFRKMEETNFSA